MALDRDFETLMSAHIEKISQLCDNKGYFLRVYAKLPELGTLRASWEAVEQERTELGLPERYSSYESFRAGKSYHHSTLVRVNTEEE